MNNNDKIIVNLFSGIILLFVYSGVLMWLWNEVITIIFMLPMISYWQAMGLYVISNILFKNTAGVKIND